MGTLVDGESEIVINGIFHVILRDDKVPDKHLIVTAKDKKDAKRKISNHRNFTGYSLELYPEGDEMMKGLTVYHYIYINDTKTEKTTSVIARDVEEARRRLAQKVGTRIKIVRAQTKRLA